MALITGSSQGIGLALARGLAQAGATAVLNGRDPQRLAAATATLAAAGLTVHQRAFDSADAVAVQEAVASIEARIGAIDILIDNAGIALRGLVHDIPASTWHAVQRTHVDGLFVCGQAVAQRMVARSHRQHLLGDERTGAP